MLLFFTADWSTACMEMRKNALTDPRVLEAARRFVGLLVDCTSEDDAPLCATLTKRYDVQGALDVTGVALTARASATGPTQGAVGSSVDAFTTVPFGPVGATDAPYSVTLAAGPFSGAVEIRIYGFAAASTAGTLRLTTTLTVTGSID